jgi:hypothetical protein
MGKGVRRIKIKQLAVGAKLLHFFIDLPVAFSVNIFVSSIRLEIPAFPAPSFRYKCFSASWHFNTPLILTKTLTADKLGFARLQPQELTRCRLMSFNMAK